MAQESLAVILHQPQHLLLQQIIQHPDQRLAPGIRLPVQPLHRLLLRIIAQQCLTEISQQELSIHFLILKKSQYTAQQSIIPHRLHRLNPHECPWPGRNLLQLIELRIHQQWPATLLLEIIPQRTLVTAHQKILIRHLRPHDPAILQQSLCRLTDALLITFHFFLPPPSPAASSPAARNRHPHYAGRPALSSSAPRPASLHAPSPYG